MGRFWDEDEEQDDSPKYDSVIEEIMDTYDIEDPDDAEDFLEDWIESD